MIWTNMDARRDKFGRHPYVNARAQATGPVNVQALHAVRFASRTTTKTATTENTYQTELQEAKMALYDELIERLKDPHRRMVLSDRQEAAEKIEHLLEVVRGYNPDDALFDDEKQSAV
jgi:hypothetical protein